MNCSLYKQLKNICLASSLLLFFYAGTVKANFEPAVNVQLIKTSAVNLAQIKINPNSFEGKKGLNGEVVLPSEIITDKKIYFTLSNQSENIVWQSVLSWKNPSKNIQHFNFSRESFKHLSGRLKLKAEVMDNTRKLLASTESTVEIDSEYNLLSVTLENNSAFVIDENSLNLDLKITAQEAIPESTLKISLFQDYLAPENLIHEHFINLKNIDVGRSVKSFEFEKPGTAGNYILAAQIIDGLSNARSGIKHWDFFIPGDFVNFRYLNTKILFEKEIKLNIHAGGSTNLNNPAMVFRLKDLYLSGQEITLEQNQWQVDETLSLPVNQKSYEIRLEFMDKNEIISTKNFNVKNPFYDKKQKIDYIKSLINKLLNSHKFQIHPKLPLIDIVQLFFISIFFILAYLLFKKNKRF